jgi:hypothetical protein
MPISRTHLLDSTACLFRVRCSFPIDGHTTSLRRTFWHPSGNLSLSASVAWPPLRIFEREEDEQRMQFDTHFDEGRDQ